ncbi:hypothetical protein HNQ51_000157 [Inhella inkyongensis]|uniref:TonB-dependent receptor n=1 Tax=Inhella inkyongensis TaxID=392593 RepID=A0A840S1X9_9BURK|nr:hypothetical protein [Inhella inkyongensis]MBB5202864.1 hypothetical protein [Inhella inkyongensis]
MKALFPLLLAGLCGAALAQAPAPGALPAMAPGAAKLQLRSLDPAKPVTLQTLRALPPDTLVQTRSGRQVPARQVLALADAIRAAQQQRPQARELQFSRSTGSPAVNLAPGVNLAAVMARPATDVVQLPNGQRLSVADLQKLDALSRQINGRGFVAGTPARAPAGPAIKIDSARDLDKLRSQPDSTVLENPQGQRITLGELRQAARRGQ